MRPSGKHNIDLAYRNTERVRPLGHRKGLAIGSLSINSLLPHIDELRCFIKEKGCHILALHDTKLDNTIADNLPTIEGFTLYRNDRNRHGGGVAVYVAESLSHHTRNNIPENGLELIVLEIELTGAKPFCVVAWYRPPSERNLELLDSKNEETILIGDANLNLSVLECTFENNSKAYQAASHMASGFDTIGLKQLINEPTRVTVDTASLIDHTADSKSENISDSGILRVTHSDHYAMYCTRKFMGSFKRQRKTITSRKMKNFDNDKFLSDISQINWKQLVDLSDNVNTAVWWPIAAIKLFNYD